MRVSLDGLLIAPPSALGPNSAITEGRGVPRLTQVEDLRGGSPPSNYANGSHLDRRRQRR